MAVWHPPYWSDWDDDLIKEEILKLKAKRRRERTMQMNAEREITRLNKNLKGLRSSLIDRLGLRELLE